MDVTKIGSTRFCRTCERVVRWIPVLFIVAMMSWAYYAYTIPLCFKSVDGPVKRTLYLIIFNILFIMVLWSYYQTIVTCSDNVPEKFRLCIEDCNVLFRTNGSEAQRQVLENISEGLPIINRTLNGSVRFCEKCKLVKPDRAHHCSVCNGCVLKMDHHCPWVNNCVGFSNYKFFILFLGYSIILCLFVTMTCIEYVIDYWQGSFQDMGRFHVLFLFFVAMMFSVSLLSLFGYHCFLVAHNRTTLETFRAPVFPGGPDKHGFDIGKYNNFKQVFGANPKTWFTPIYTSLGDGIDFPTNSLLGSIV